MRSFARLHKRLATETPRKTNFRAVAWTIAGGGLAAAAKTVAASLTGSASLLADAVQSWIAMFTEILMLAAYRSAQRPPSAEYPVGHGRESYVWSLLAAIGMFVVGAQVGVWRGLIRLHSDDFLVDYRIGYAVLAVMFVLQAASLVQAWKFARQQAAKRQRGVWQYIMATSDAQLRTVVADDLIGLFGLIFAGLGMALHQWTGDVEYDAAGSIAIGVMMAVAGLLMINVNRRFLAGATVPPALRNQALRWLREVPEVARVTMLYMLYVGPNQVLLAARVAIEGDHDQQELARILHRIEQEFMEDKGVVRTSLQLALPEEQALD